jgi:hypothetical protein
MAILLPLVCRVFLIQIKTAILLAIRLSIGLFERAVNKCI